MTQAEINKLLALTGKCSGDAERKAEFKRLSMKLLRAVAKVVGGKVSFNPGGIAVSGDASLHSETLHLFFNADGIGSPMLGICGRTCKGASDNQGGPNRWFSGKMLAETGVDGLVAWAVAVQARL